ncbi:MAG: MFS transporter [Betaproteobacteria bacterium]|nr:MFS transporter [Betaproteobacteria bacterium]
MSVDARQVALRLASFYFVYFLLIGAFQPFFPLYLKSLGLSAADIGVLLSINPLVRAVGPNVWAWLADHRGERVSLTRLSAVGCVVCFALVMWGTSFTWLWISILILNLFWCGTLPLMEASTFSHLRGQLGLYGRIRVWGSFSYVIAVVGLGYFFEWAPISAVLWVLLLIFVGIAWSSYLLPADKVDVRAGPKPPIGEILRQPEVIALLGACLFMSMAHGPYNTFFSIHLEEHGFSKSTIGWLWAIGVLAEVGVFYAIQTLHKRFTVKELIAFSLACAVVRFVFIGWLIAIPGIAWLSQVLHGATFGVFHAAALAAIHTRFKEGFQARGQALYTSIGFGIGGSIGGLYSGFAWEHLGPGATFGLGALCALIALGLILKWWPRSESSR